MGNYFSSVATAADRSGKRSCWDSTLFDALPCGARIKSSDQELRPAEKILPATLEPEDREVLERVSVSGHLNAFEQGGRRRSASDLKKMRVDCASGRLSGSSSGRDSSSSAGGNAKTLISSSDPVIDPHGRPSQDLSGAKVDRLHSRRI